MPPPSTTAKSNTEDIHNGQDAKPNQVPRHGGHREALRCLSVQVRKSTSWYGSLGRKASASTQVAKETIMGGTVKSASTADFSRYEGRRNADGSGDSDAQSTQTMPMIAETEVDVHPAQTSQPSQQDTNGSANHDAQTQQQPHIDPAPEELASENNKAASQVDKSPSEIAPQPVASPGWFAGWFGTSSAPEMTKDNKDELMTDVSKGSEPAPLGSSQETLDEALPPPPANTEAPPAAEPTTPKPTRPTSAWLGSWWGTPAQSESALKGPPEATVSEAPLIKESEDLSMEDAPPPAPAAQLESQPSAGSTWAFWSRDTGSKAASQSKPTPEQGELAVMGEGSEASPRRYSSVGVEEPSAISVKEPPLRKDPRELPAKTSRSKKNKRERPQSMDLDQAVPMVPSTPVTTTSTAKPETPASIKSLQPNLVLPSFRNTYQMKQNPSIIKQITQLLLRTRQPVPTHVNLVKEPPKIRKAIAIGVHGLFPATYLRPMIGQPTGTSIRFANKCAEAIRRWADSHGCQDCEIEKVALEGEGRIADRVDNLWKLLLNWIEHIRKADLILVACHSQGVPVGLMLVSKLIDLGIITTARIGVCAMAGVSLGPFPDYKSGMGMLMGSAAELWQFADPSSEISQRLEHAMKTVLEHGGRVTYVGSIDDQLVPLESAIYSPASHPYIYRAVFIDGRVHAPDFIAHLVGFALKLRNLGISDQGLIRELSVALAGSLYSGEGHSRLYDDDEVYNLAVSHALETTVVNNVPCRIDKHEGLASSNPYILPWIMRGLLEENFVKTELSAETAELLKQFDDWKPATKALKDIKFRLEAVRSRL
ncbi:hypothetical protein BKA67DRAFT_509001 [Truncatella angustata]|uniref:YMC020W-like alpha/beta hydrolase domain-containing protein n=1 Tax=Truncatella angustata TaxID=152316 RepID=A0A9P9A2K2_9PEZI|nr:uncharacterized protein BKA67DRAFT_509001 [Truncatella angustata]KAH6660781.1 hypothetical protein BKA67DRAFT_509001 [Truncatella angustata]